MFQKPGHVDVNHNDAKCLEEFYKKEQRYRNKWDRREKPTIVNARNSAKMQEKQSSPQTGYIGWGIARPCEKEKYVLKRSGVKVHPFRKSKHAQPLQSEHSRRTVLKAQTYDNLDIFGNQKRQKPLRIHTQAFYDLHQKRVKKDKMSKMRNRVNKEFEEEERKEQEKYLKAGGQLCPGANRKILAHRQLQNRILPLTCSTSKNPKPKKKSLKKKKHAHMERYVANIKFCRGTIFDQMDDLGVASYSLKTD